MCKQIKIFLVTALEIAAIFVCTSQMMAQIPYTTTKSQDCGQNYGAPKGRVGLRRVADPEGGWQTKGFVVDSFGPMPQTAYDPNFGCYPGNARTINRYPAFHGYYYARPYNYRHYAEYPWNAEITEPRPFQRNPRVGTEVNVPNDGSSLPSIMTPVENQPEIENSTPEITEAESSVSNEIPEEADSDDDSTVVPAAEPADEPMSEPAAEPATKNSTEGTLLDENISATLNDDLFN